jgi:DNA-directed RNA polymerase beta subunit
MNIGQIYETVLGWAGKKLGLKFLWLLTFQQVVL